MQSRQNTLLGFQTLQGSNQPSEDGLGKNRNDRGLEQVGRGVKCTVANTVCSQEDVKPEIRSSVLGGGEGPPCRLEFRQLWQPQSFCVSSLTQCFFYVASCLLNSVPDNFVVKWLSGSMAVSHLLESQEE